jgi:hypothetical protein
MEPWRRTDVFVMRASAAPFLGPTRLNCGFVFFEPGEPPVDYGELLFNYTRCSGGSEG